MDEKMLRIGIVTIGYNRINSLKRLLNRLNDCEYPEGDIPLVVSLDNCGNNEVYDFARGFEWKHGTKRVILQPERLGLRKHVLRCGRYMEEYDWDAQIVLEDDVYTSAAFYHYARQAVAFYRHDDRIAGIALYGLRQNQTVRYPFAPMLSKYDSYFMQLAQSCGQVWMRDQWRAFTDWYEKNNDNFRECPHVPFNVCRWPDRSWLKYHIRYCVENNKYFSYPYQSLTTNFSDIGSNTAVKTRVLQLELQGSSKAQYHFPALEDDAVFYDAWCESMDLAAALGIDKNEICIDLYGVKGNYDHKRYWLTTLSSPYRILRSFALELMPMDQNVACNLEGNQIFLYDTTEAGEAPATEDRELAVWSFNNRLMYPDPMIMKLAKPLIRELWKYRFSLLLHPVQLFRRIWDHIV